MKYLKTINRGLVLIAIVMFNIIGFAGHASAMNTMSHEMTGMNRRPEDAAQCASLCSAVVLNKESDDLKRIEIEGDDDIAGFPVSQSRQAWELAKSLVKQRLYASEVKPPPKVSRYILYQVFRT